MRIHMMTASLTTGDAIGNYNLALQRAFRKLGISVHLYADYIDPAFKGEARPTSAYRPTGKDILYFHYSIWSDNFAVLDSSPDFKVLDYHGVAPPHLAADFDPRLAALCRTAINALPRYAPVFDWGIYHAASGQADLEQAGYARLSRVRLPIDESIFGAQEDEVLGELLGRLDYLLFVGRIVPQKDILAILNVFAGLYERRPDVFLFLVGGHDVLPGYVQQVRDEIQRRGIAHRVYLTDKISNRAVLTSLYRHARFLLILSEWESFCVPAAEALFVGVPIVYTNVAPLPEIVGDAGVLIDKTDPAAAAGQIDEVWEDSALHAQLRENARARSHWFTDAALLESLRSLLNDWARAYVGPTAPPAIEAVRSLTICA